MGRMLDRRSALLLSCSFRYLAIASGVIASFLTPLRADAFVDKRAQGAELFATRGCAHCHGENGEGSDRAPALRELRKKLSGDKIKDQIVHGGQGMPAFADSLNAEETEDLVVFLRAKKWVPAQKEGSPTSAQNAQ